VTKHLVFTMSLMIFCSSWAHKGGNIVGNGGDAIVCRNAKHQIARAELFDFYEQDQMPRDKFAAHTEQEILATVLQRLRRVHSELAEQYENRLKELQTEIDFKPKIELVDIHDSKQVFQPMDGSCKMEQIAIRRTQTSPGQKRFVVRQDFWSKMDLVSKAGLILHEVVNEHFFKLGELDSRKARNFNVLLFSANFPAMNKNDYWKYVKDLKVPLYR
jgi:hypothetical protein